MKEFLLTVTRKGQVTIPREARAHLGIEEKKNKRKLALVLAEQGKVTLTALQYPDLASLRGAAGKLDQERTWEETRKIAREDRLAPPRKKGK